MFFSVMATLPLLPTPTLLVSPDHLFKVDLLHCPGVEVMAGPHEEKREGADLGGGGRMWEGQCPVQSC